MKPHVQTQARIGIGRCRKHSLLRFTDSPWPTSRTAGPRSTSKYRPHRTGRQRLLRVHSNTVCPDPEFWRSNCGTGHDFGHAWTVIWATPGPEVGPNGRIIDMILKIGVRTWRARSDTRCSFQRLAYATSLGGRTTQQALRLLHPSSAQPRRSQARHRRPPGPTGTG